MSDLSSHEKECALRFKAIEDRLERGSARMDRMEARMNSLFMVTVGVYPFI